MCCRSITSLLLFATLWLQFLPISEAAEANVQQGDNVCVRHSGTWKEATVLDMPLNGQVNVEFKSGTRMSVSLSQILQPEEGHELVGPETVLKPGDKVKAISGIRWENSEIVKVHDDGTVTVLDGRLTKRERTVPRGTLELPKPARPKPMAVAAKEEPNPLAGIRTWTDSSGKHKVEASFQKVVDGKVSLLKADGTSIALPLERLSDADREIANFLAKAKPVASTPTANNPFGLTEEPPAPKKSKSKGSTSSTPSLPPGPVLEPKEDWSEVFELSLRNAGAFEVPPGATTAPQVTFTERPITLSEPVDKFWDMPLEFFLAAGNKRAVVVHKASAPRNPTPFRFDLCDLEAGKLVGSYQFPGNHRPIALSPSGKRLVTFTEYYVDQPALANLWQLEDSGKLKHVACWPALRKESAIPPAVRSGQFVDEDHVLLYDSQNNLALWNVKAVPKAVYTAKIKDNSATPGLTPSGKQLLAVIDNSVALFDALSGKVLGAVEVSEDAEQARLSPDGTKIAVLGKSTIGVLDAKSRKITREFSLPDGVNGKMVWADNQFLLFDDSRLVDTELGVVAWLYDRPPLKAGYLNKSPTHAVGSKFWFIEPAASGGRATLVSTTLPHPAVKQVLAGLDREKLQMFPPGVKVQLKLDLPTLKEEDKPQVSAALTKALQDTGAEVVASGGALILEASSRKGESSAVQFGAGIFGQKSRTAAAFTPNIYHLRVKQNEAVIWSSSLQTSPPNSISLKLGQTVETVIKGLSEPKPDFFLKTTFPKQLLRPGPHDGAYGKSKL